MSAGVACEVDTGFSYGKNSSEGMTYFYPLSLFHTDGCLVNNDNSAAFRFYHAV